MGEFRFRLKLKNLFWSISNNILHSLKKKKINSMKQKKILKKKRRKKPLEIMLLNLRTSKVEQNGQII